MGLGTAISRYLCAHLSERTFSQMAASYALMGPVHKVTIFPHSNKSNLREIGVASAHSSRYSPPGQGSQGIGTLTQLATSVVQGCPPSRTAIIFRLLTGPAHQRSSPLPLLTIYSWKGGLRDVMGPSPG